MIKSVILLFVIQAMNIIQNDHNYTITVNKQDKHIVKLMFMDLCFKYNVFSDIDEELCKSMIPKELWYDKEFVLNVVKENGQILETFSNDMIQNDRDIIMNAVTNYGYALKYASKELQNDREVVMSAVRNAGWALQFASRTLKDDYDIVMNAVIENGLALEYASKELRDNPNIVMSAIDTLSITSSSAFKFASKNLKNDPEFILKALQKDNRILKYVSKNLLK